MKSLLSSIGILILGFLAMLGLFAMVSDLALWLM